MERVKAQAAWAEAERMQKESDMKAALAKAQDTTPTKSKTKPVNGYFIWQRNEHNTLRFGPVEKPWKKKVDKNTGRIYFKNVENKTTTWVDPRSREGRKHDPLECVVCSREIDHKPDFVRVTSFPMDGTRRRPRKALCFTSIT